MLDVVPHGENALPPRDGIGANDGVHGFQLGTDVLRGAAGAGMQLEALSLGDGVEARLLERDGEAFEELLVRRADAVVELVARRPQRVYVWSALASADLLCLLAALIAAGGAPPPVLGSSVSRSDV